MSSERALAILAELKAADIVVRHLVNDSRRVQTGDVFLAYPGAATDGRNYVDMAIKRGAAAILIEEDGYIAGSDNVPRSVPIFPVMGLKSLSGDIAAQVYGHPSSHLRLIGVTGTNGKTSTTQWIAETLVAAGQRCAVIGTLGNGYPGGLDASGTANTTPDALALHALLARYVQGGAAACAMEVSSIGLDQDRCAGAHFDVAVFTNLTRDHLDYHGSMEAYAEAKKALFRWPSLGAAVVNLDDPVGLDILAESTARVNVGYFIGEASGPVLPASCSVILRAGEVEDNPAGVAFTLYVDGYPQRVEASVIGRFNIANLLAVAGVLLASGVEVNALPRLLGGVHPVPGRLQRFGGVHAPLVAVDYAHTPDALANALGALRPVAMKRGGRLICVFGCGGDRDQGKRPLMGEVATRLADEVWLTADNSRSEDPRRILEQIKVGATHSVICEVDRTLAVAGAVASAVENDVVLVAGKGHEDYQEMHGHRLPYSDALVVNGALAAWREARESIEENKTNGASDLLAPTVPLSMGGNGG